MVNNLSAMQKIWFDPWVRKTHWRREWKPSPVFLPEEFHGQRSLWATVHEATKSQTQLSTNTFSFPIKEKEIRMKYFSSYINF